MCRLLMFATVPACLALDLAQGPLLQQAGDRTGRAVQWFDETRVLVSRQTLVFFQLATPTQWWSGHNLNTRYHRK